MTERLLCERDVLVKTGWPSRQYIDARMRHDGFPHPNRRLHGIGDQWREAEVDAWITGGAGLAHESRIDERFKVA